MKEPDYLSLFQAPPKEARGWTRWWWYGPCVEKCEIDRELDFMQDAGIGGVELQILYAVEADDPVRGIHNIPFGSPEFYDILDYTSQACKSRGMLLDITPGSSWPYGGPFIEDEDAQQEAIPYQYDITGPCEFECDFTTRFAGNVCAAVMGRMEHSRMIPESVIDITSSFKDRFLFGWPWGTELEKIHIPEGDWKIVFFVISMHRNRVGKPGRNAEGRVIDHCSAKALEVFLDNMVEPIADRVANVNGWFCDSVEVEGHNWSGLLLSEFKKRRGYDLSPYIYALWGDMGDITPMVRYDYFKTMGELTIENFFDGLTSFAHKHNGISRIQAHGTWGDILRVYAAADIPEGETFGDHRVLEVNTIHRRLAASAGHVYGRPVISNETFTWLKRPRFTETLEEMKAAVDAVFCDGINMIVNHGYAYSPEKAGKRGWPFYASTHINHTTPWWPYYHHLAGYIQRVSAMLRRGYNVADVAVYLPTADVYSENMLSELHLAMRMEEYLGRSRMDAIQKAGYWFDYINDEALTDLCQFKDGGLFLGENRYRVLILPDCHRLPVETAKAMNLFVKAGGLLIAAGSIPDDTCGMVHYEENREIIRSCMSEIFSQPNAISLPDCGDTLIRYLHDSVIPDVSVSDPQHVGYVHRCDGADHIYFLTNIRDSLTSVTVTFSDRTEPFCVFRCIPDSFGSFNKEIMGCCGGNTISLSLEAHESVFVIFSPEFSSDSISYVEESARKNHPLRGWTLSVSECAFTTNMDTPVSWEKYPELSSYSGTGTYSCSVSLEEVPRDVALSISGLSCACSVYVNNSFAGDIWTHPHLLQISKFLKPGKNTLEIRVTSTLINEMRTCDPDSWPHHATVLDNWPYYGKIIDNQLKVRMNTHREHDEQLNPLPSGLWGNVSLYY